MSAIGRNTTYFYGTTICSEDYAKGEARGTKKVVEVACSHFFHIKCIESKIIKIKQDFSLIEDDAEHIKAIPEKLVKTVYNFAASAFGY